MVACKGECRTYLSRSVLTEQTVVPLKDGCAVRAEGLTHHQAKLVPLHEARKDLGIKYRSLTQTRDDLVEVAVAVKYRELADLAGCV